MPKLMRAALAALVVSAALLAPASSPAQAGQAQRPSTASTQPARPAPVVRRPGVQPAVTVARDTTAGRAGPARERWNDISVASANSGVYHIPAGRGHAGPTILRIQVLLSRAFFSTGMMDGYWGRNIQGAVQFFQAREGLPVTGTVDSATYAQLVRVAGDPLTVVPYALTADDVRGPFVRIPEDIYAHARLSCSCFESLAEKLSERFHARVEMLRKLNPDVNLDSVAPGDTLYVPAVRPADARVPGEIRQLVVSGAGSYLQALDANGRIMYHFAATLGSTYDPSPNGDFMVTSVHENPWWHYQPKLLAHVPDDRPNARIPPGPNSAVGRVWMSLSAPHYGIHGTRSPETIGYAQSAGCVRLTNWDALFLSKQVVPGTPVAFRDTRPDTAAAPAGQGTPAQPAVIGTRADSVRTNPAAPRPSAPATPRDTVRTTVPARPAAAQADSVRPASRPATPTAAPGRAPAAQTRPDSARAAPPAPRP